MRDEDVKEFASQLRSAGIDARVGRIRRRWEGYCVRNNCGGGFPVWELNGADNQELLVARDFAAIKAKRDADWEPVEPGLRRRVRGRP